jgi:beta-phosphoglucomutase-like phosphatase (HAD superfamily)
MTTNPALDAAIRQTRHLLFSFDGPIRSANAGNPTDSPPAPHIHDALTACYESSRSVSVISVNPPADVHAYLEAHDLATYVVVVPASIREVANFLESSPADCLLITSSPDEIKAAQASGIPSIGYTRTSGDADHLVDAGAVAFVFSMADLALTLRAQSDG